MNKRRHTKLVREGQYVSGKLYGAATSGRHPVPAGYSPSRPPRRERFKGGLRGLSFIADPLK
jgi:hypothetical protein